MAIKEFTVNPGTYFRQPGYPLLITASLYPWTLSLIALLAVQATFSALIPWLIYRILLYASKPLAILGALVSIITLLPYLFQTLLYPDQTQLFFLVLFCYVLIKFWFESTIKNMVLMFVVYACMSFLRPPFLLFYLFFPLIIGTVAWIDRKELKYSYFLTPFAALSIAVAALNFSASALDKHLYAQRNAERPSMNGKVLFLNAFINSTGVDGAFEDGEYANILRSKLVDFFHNAPPEVRDIRNLRASIADRFVQYQLDPERMVDAIMNERTNHTWWVLFNISDRYFGKEGDPLFMNVALEQYRLHPRIFWNVLKRGFAYYLGVDACTAPVSGFPGEYECVFYPTLASGYEDFGFPHFGPYTGMKSYTLHLLGQTSLARVGGPFVAYATTVWPAIYRTILPLGSLLTGLGLIFILYRALFSATPRKMPHELPVMLGVVSVFILYIGPMIILTDPEFRYVSAGVLFVLMSGLLSLQMLVANSGLRWWTLTDPPPERLKYRGSIAIASRSLAFWRGSISNRIGRINRTKLMKLSLIGFFGVALIFLMARTLFRPPTPIEIVSATYGESCRAFSPPPPASNWVQEGNVTDPVRAACSGENAKNERCSVLVNPAVWGDPAQGCGKDFSVSHRCRGEKQARTTSIAAEAAGKIIEIDCRAPSFGDLWRQLRCSFRQCDQTPRKQL